MRGRLINPFLVDIAQLDTAATAADPDGGGELTSGYDDDFNEVVKVPSATKEGGASARQETAIVQLMCQVENDLTAQQAQLLSGDAGEFLFRLVFHFEELEDAGMVDPNGRATVRVNDRIVALRDCDSGELIREFLVEEGGAYITHALDRSYGLSGGKRNLLVCTVQEREQGLRNPPV